MADIVDLGNDVAQTFLDDKLKAVRAGKKGEPGIGICLNCGTAVYDSRRWCDAACRDDWDKRQAQQPHVIS